MSIRKRESKKHPGGVYEIYFYYSDNGVRKRHSESGHLTLQEAKKREVELKAIFENKNKLKKNEKVTFIRTYEEFLKRESDQYSCATIRSTKMACSHFIRYLEKEKKSNILITHVDYDLLRDFFKAYQNDTKKKNEYIRNGLNRVFKYAMRAGYVDDNPIKLIVVKGKPPLTSVNSYIPESVFNSLIKELMLRNDFLNNAVAVACMISYYTGFRASEVLALRKEDIDFERRIIRMNKKIEYRDSVKELYITETLKTQESYAEQPMPKPLKEVLLKWMQVNPYELLICTFEGELINSNMLLQHSKCAAKRIGFDSFTFHSLRHTFVTNLVLNKVDLKTVQELARHKNISVTLGVYTHITESAKKEALNKTFSKNVENGVENDIERLTSYYCG